MKKSRRWRQNFKKMIFMISGHSVVGTRTLVRASEAGREVEATSRRHQGRLDLVHREGQEPDGPRASAPAKNPVRLRAAKLPGQRQLLSFNVQRNCYNKIQVSTSSVLR